MTDLVNYRYVSNVGFNPKLSLDKYHRNLQLNAKEKKARHDAILDDFNSKFQGLSTETDPNDIIQNSFRKYLQSTTNTGNPNTDVQVDEKTVDAQTEDESEPAPAPINIRLEEGRLYKASEVYPNVSDDQQNLYIFVDGNGRELLLESDSTSRTQFSVFLMDEYLFNLQIPEKIQLVLQQSVQDQRGLDDIARYINQMRSSWKYHLDRFQEIFKKLNLEGTSKFKAITDMINAFQAQSRRSSEIIHENPPRRRKRTKGKSRSRPLIPDPTQEGEGISSDIDKTQSVFNKTKSSRNSTNDGIKINGTMYKDPRNVLAHFRTAVGVWEAGNHSRALAAEIRQMKAYLRSKGYLH